MPGVFRLKYRDGREEEHWGHRGYYYVMGSDHLELFLPDPAWCHHCDAITIAERAFRSLSEILREMEENKNPQSAGYIRRFMGRKPDYIGAVQFALAKEWEHARIRKSPSHCMECGKTKVSHFIWNEWQPHPKTGEEVLFQCVGMGSTNFARRFFDPQGEELTLTESERKHYLSLV